MTIYRRSSTTRPAPRIVLESTWHEQPQAATSSSQHLRSCGKLQQHRHDGEHHIVQGVAGNCSKHNIVEDENSFQIDLRVPGVSQDKLCSSLFWIPEVMRLKRNSKVACRNQERYITRLSGNAVKTSSIGFMWPRDTRKRHNVLANKIACHRCLQDSAAWLYRKSDISETWDHFISTTL